MTHDHRLLLPTSFVLFGLTLARLSGRANMEAGRLSWQVEGSEPEPCLTGGDPHLSASEHHPLVPDKGCLEGGCGDDLPDAWGHDLVLGGNELLTVADGAPDLSRDSQRIVHNTGQELDVAGPKGCLDAPEAGIRLQGIEAQR